MRARRLLLGIALAATAAAATHWAFGPRAASAQPADVALATLHTQSGAPTGAAILTQHGPYVQVSVEVSGLTPGLHGFHVHAVGNCDPATQFTSAGGHYNPDGTSHAGHAGDLPSLWVNVDGTASMSFTIDRFIVEDLFDADGSALVVHADRDNFAHFPARYGIQPDQMTLATGDAGPRVACGMIDRAAGASVPGPASDQRAGHVGH